MEQVIEVYKGVEIELSCGYYYPHVNGDIECRTIAEVKEWIDDIWMFIQNSKKRLGYDN